MRCDDYHPRGSLRSDEHRLCIPIKDFHKSLSAELEMPAMRSDAYHHADQHCWRCYGHRLCMPIIYIQKSR